MVLCDREARSVRAEQSQTQLDLERHKEERQAEEAREDHKHAPGRPGGQAF